MTATPKEEEDDGNQAGSRSRERDGVIGKRVADAVALQDDMELVGVADVVHDYRVRVAVERGYPIYAARAEKRAEMEAAGAPLRATSMTCCGKWTSLSTARPSGLAQNKARYQAAGVKAIWQGGEPHELAGYSFVAQANYAGAVGRDYARIVSCNTTALIRVLHALHGRGWVKRARAVLMRRATDPWESHLNGMINTAVPETKVPSHQGPDAQTVTPDLDITTMAGSGPYNLSHLHLPWSRRPDRSSWTSCTAPSPRSRGLRWCARAMGSWRSTR